MAARAVVKDVGRAFGMPFSFTDRITKLIPAELNITIERSLLESSELAALAKQDYMVEKVLSYGALLEGLPRHASVHAAGVVITPGELVNFVPLYRTNQDEITTQYDKDSIEAIGLLKMDFLGLRTLTIIQDTINRVKESGKGEIDIEKLDLNDRKTFELLGRGETEAVFQFESEGMKRYLRKLKPDKLEDLIAMNALYRPGPIRMIDEYIRRKHSAEKPNYIFPELESILAETYGIIVYQEQVMLIAQAVAGFTLQEADELRRAMGKKKPEIMAKMREKFIEGAKKRKKDLKQVEELFELMEEFSKYGFNKSHSAAYALLAYQTAYLKAHFPLEFLAANLTAEMGNATKIAELLVECRRKGVEVLPPDINKSVEWFTVENEKIRFGLGAIKNLGSSAIQSIIEARKRLGKFDNFYQFCSAVDTRKVNKRAIESLIKSGAMDSLGSRAELLKALDDALEHSSSKEFALTPFLFGTEQILPTYKPLPKAEPIPKLTLLAMEKEVLGVYMSGHP
ncbi:MAG: DNA polymerase III subunit alpha, partial [bacterium]